MNNGAAAARALLDAWREQRADGQAPARLHFIEALERRAAGLGGAARRALDERLSILLEGFAAEFGRPDPAGPEDAKAPEVPEPSDASKDPDAGATATPCTTARGPLGELADALAAQAAARDAALASDNATGSTAAFPALAMLGDFRKLWSTLRAESQLRQSLEPAPTGAGPLNSGSLVHRSLTLMHELAPGYLQAFLPYLDTLAWLERMHEGGALYADRDAPRVTGARKRSR